MKVEYQQKLQTVCNVRKLPVLEKHSKKYRFFEFNSKSWSLTKKTIVGPKNDIVKSLNDDVTDILSSQRLQLNQFKLLFIAIWPKYAMTEQLFVDFEVWFIRKNAKNHTKTAWKCINHDRAGTEFFLEGRRAVFVSPMKRIIVNFLKSEMSTNKNFKPFAMSQN